MIARLVILGAIFGLMQVARSFAPNDGPLTSTSAGALAFGFLMLASFFMGRVFATLRLPRLTGYLFTGMLAGPYVLGLVTRSMTGELKILNGCAVSLIAITAGVETDFKLIRPLIKSIGLVSVVGVVGTQLLLAVVIFAMKPLLPFLAPLSVGETIAVAGVLGVTLSAQSPAVVCALRDEMRSEGPVTRTVLGVVVLSDLLVLMLFAITSSLAQAVLHGRADVRATALDLSWEILGSLGVGLVLGGVVAFYLRQVKTGASLFLVAMSFVVAEIGSRFELDPLLVCLAAGMLVRNTTKSGRFLAEEVERAWLPLSMVFFSVAGATIHLDVLPLVALPVAIIILVRGTGLVLGSRLGAQMAGAPPEVVKWAGFGLLPQAGLALALALLFTKTFPSFGDGASALALGVVACNEILAPALFRIALVRSGESGTLDPSEAAEAAPH